VSLPARPNLRHLKGQAKDLLARGAATSIADAQFQIARRYGFASWPRLKAHVDAIATGSATTGGTLTRGALIDTIMAFLEGHDLLALADIRAALGRELEAAGPKALLELQSRLAAGTDWDFYPADPLARRIHRILADRLLEPGSGIDGIAHTRPLLDERVVIFGNHLSYADANLLDILLRRSGASALADRLVAIAGPKVYSSHKRRFSSLCFGTIRTPQSSALSTDEAAMPPREVARAARRSIDLAHERLRQGDALLVFAEGTRSRAAVMQRMLAGASRYLDGPDVAILPAGIVGTEALFPVDAESLHRVTVRIIIGAPLDGALLRASAGGDRQLMMDAVGAAIAALLPAGYRGAYSDGSVDLTEARRVVDRVRRESTGRISAGSQ
jgi:1-acyl-sn-glycerol-3-phosphate acyltransferase